MVLNALNWLVNEMEYRYTLFSKNRVSNLAEYNASGQERLPKLVLIVDEVGDIMTSSISKEFEVLIKRLAQKARAGHPYHTRDAETFRRRNYRYD